MEQKPWLFHLSLDLKECDRTVITSPEILKNYLIAISNCIDMHRYGEATVHRFGSNELEGWSGGQYIEESNITFHCDEQNGNNSVYIDIVSCKKFDVQKAIIFSVEYFNAKGVNPFYRER
jgi:S-adenosylmethionine/arginine decarboxylase-like enzyme